MWIARAGILSSSVASSSLLTGLVSYYKAESNANDSVGGNNGTAQGGLVYATGKDGNSFQFNGTNAYILYPDNSWNITGDFTISIWVYHTNGAAQSLISNRAFTNTIINKGWGLGVNNISGAQTSIVTWGQFIGPSSSSYTGWEYRTTPLTLNAWNHILIYRISGVNTYCEVNGVLQSATIFGTNSNVTLDPTYDTITKSSIGASLTQAGVASAYTKSNMKIDEFGIWNRQLTTQERTDLYNAGAGKFYPTF